MGTPVKTPAFVGTCDLKFGAHVQNKITGDEGLVTAKFYQISGCTVICYTSTTLRDRDNKPVYFHATLDRLEVIREVLAPPIFDTQPKEESNFRLGEKVEAPLYGITGIVTCIAFYPDQSNHLEIQPPYNNEKGKLPEVMSLAESLVQSLEHKPVAPTEAAKRPSPPQEPSPGVHTSRD